LGWDFWDVTVFPFANLLLAHAFLHSWIGTAPEEAAARGDGVPVPSFLMGSLSPFYQLTLLPTLQGAGRLS
jgi:hypothetical protein